MSPAKQFVELDDFRIARQFLDRLVVGVRQKRRRLFAGQLQILDEEFFICVNYPPGLSVCREAI